MPRFPSVFLLVVVLLTLFGVGSASAQDAGVPEAEAEHEAEDEEDEGEASEPTQAEAVAEEDLPEYQPRTQLREPRTLCHGKRIRRIIVNGTLRVADEDVIATIDVEVGAPCTDPEISRSARSLWQLGVFDDIVFSVEAVGDDAVDLYIDVEERRAIGRIQFRGNDEVSDSDLDEKVTLQTGEVLLLNDVRSQVTRIRDLYAEKGFFLARVNYELRELPNNEVEVTFRIDEGSEVTVRSIQFTGNNNITDSELTGFMRTSATGFFSIVASNDSFNRSFFEEDVQRLQALYYDRGYLTVQVGTPRVELTPDRQHIDIIIPLEEGPRFRIGQLRVAEVDDDGEEIEPLGGRRRVREMIEANPGEWFNRTAIAESLQAITRHYRDDGFALVEMVPQTDLDMDARTVDVILSIRRGPPVRIERINIRGNTKTRDQVIRREIEISEGELYSMSGVELAKARITALGYFERVDVSEEEGSRPDRLVINFEVQERSTGTFQVGAGFSSIESFIFTAQVQQQNLFGRGQSLSLQLQLSGVRQNAQIQLVEPWLFGTRWSMAVDAFKTVRDFSLFNRDSTGGSLAVGHPIFTDRLRLSARYRLEHVDISSRQGSIFGGVSQGRQIFRQIPLTNLFQAGFTSSVQLTLTYDARNNRLEPTEGFFLSASSEMADEVFLSENNFNRHRITGRFYQELFGGFVLKLNTEWGLIHSRDPEGVPIYERFFLGGIFNVRGFEFNALGPRLGIQSDLNPTAGVSNEGIPFGGNMQFYYNLELEFPIIEEVGIRGVIFHDAGNAWNMEDSLCGGPAPANGDSATDPCRINPFELRTSWGFGLRWISPLGPLRFEWGLPFITRDYEDDIRFEFTIGNFF